MFPYLSLLGFRRRTRMPAPDVDLLEQLEPGWIEQSIADWSSWINARLRKRYGTAAQGSSTPFGKTPPAFLPQGTTPPGVTLQGRPLLGDIALVLAIVTAGAAGVATFQWSVDGGISWAIAPTLTASGTSPPAVTVAGLSRLASPSLLRLQVQVGGPVGTAKFRWSVDGGVTWTASGVITAPTVVLGTTGLSAVFPAGTYSADNAYVGAGIVTPAVGVPFALAGTGLAFVVGAGPAFAADNEYQAATPVPGTMLRWLTILVTFDAYQKRGANPQDPALTWIKDAWDETKAEIREAADSKDGLFDLPASEDVDSAITTGGPLGYSETSPYVWTDAEERAGRAEDRSRSGTGGP